MAAVNQTFLIYGIIILLGYCLKRFNVLKESDGKCLINLIYYATLPAVILSIFNNQKFNSEMTEIFFVSIGYGILITMLSLWFFRKGNANSHKGLIISSALGFNIPLFSYPFVQAIWGSEGMRYLAIFDMGNAFIIFGLAYIIAAYFSPESESVKAGNIARKLLFFAPLQCYVIALILCVLKIELPVMVMDVLKPLTLANTPLVLIVLGLYLNFSGVTKYLKSIFNVLFLRYATGAAIGILIFFFLPCNNTMKTMLVLALMNPVGLAMIAYSIYFKYDVKLAGSLINISNIISFILVWGISMISISKII